MYNRLYGYDVFFWRVADVLNEVVEKLKFVRQELLNGNLKLGNIQN